MTADGRLPEDQRRNYKHVFDAVWRIRKDEGLSGLWRGTVPSVARAMTANVTQLMSYDSAKKYFTETCKTFRTRVSSVYVGRPTNRAKIFGG